MDLLRRVLVVSMVLVLAGTCYGQQVQGNSAALFSKTNPIDSIGIFPPASFTSWNLTLPTTPGTSNYFLQTDGAGVTTWASATSSGMTNPMTTAGDMIDGGTAGAPARLGIGGKGEELFVFDLTGLGDLYPAWQTNPFFQETSLALSAGNNNNVSIGYNTASIATASSSTITGIAVPAAINVVRIFNSSDAPITIANENANSTAGNRFITLTGADESMPNGAVKLFTYETNSYTIETRWVETSSNPAPYTGTGSVTSFSASGLAALFTTSVVTATTTPALSFSPVAVTDHQFYAGIIGGGSAAPAFRAIVLSDLPSITNAALANSTIGLTSTGGTLTPSGSPVSLGGSGNYEINLGHSNTWTVAQTFLNVLINGAAPVANAGISIKNDHIQSQQTIAPAAGAIATGCGTAGGGGTLAVATLTHATDVAGTIAISTTDGALHPGGVNPAAGAIVQVSYNAAYTTAPMVELTPANATTAAIEGYVSATGTTSFTIGVTGTPPGATVTTYTWIYHIIETQ